ncbi:glutathione S-transferase family protein [Pararhizobium mangrovi]|uniref:Glutathione S-transferase family protein n=1 Tax=Pararhizobium mangrovi TaxID=2590452 RepID=A0A506TZ33_9HYPH|nr:glutathione S-transferase family protein [Pararhizobium mangrovi]TPW25985.1 glutathione S-transferase family protein [Pararhizobium mangrovi]
MLKIWGRLNSINVEKVIWCAGEAGVDFERIDAGGKFGLVDTPEFRHRNPCGKVPVIDDDGFLLWESNAIVRYLAAKHAPGKLLAEDAAARAQAERWMDYQLGTIAPLLSPLFRGIVRTAPKNRNRDEISSAFHALADALTIVDGALNDGPYLVGEDFTVADIPLGTVAHRWFNMPVEEVGLERPRMAALQAWYETLRERPAVSALFAAPLS